MKIENRLAIHLSGVLEEMTYEGGINFLEGLMNALYGENVYVKYKFRKLEEVDGYRYCGECDSIVRYMNRFLDIDKKDEENLLKPYAIQSVSFRFCLNPTSVEMVEYMEAEGKYDFDKDDENDVAEQFEKCFFDDCVTSADEEIFEEFDDIVTYWDVVIDEEGHYYRGGDNKLKQHKEHKYIDF